MKKFYENNRKLFYGSIAGLCLLVCVVVLGAASFMGADQKNTEQKQKTVQAASTVVEKKEPEKDSRKDEEAEPTPEAVSPEAAEPEEPVAVESEEPVMPETPAPQVTETPKAENTPAPAPVQTPAPSADLSNMAQNVPFPYEIHVNKQMNCVTVYAMDLNGVYSIPYKAMVCSTGNATPLGTYKTPAKYRWKVLMGNVWGQYSTRVVGGILFHSVQYRTNRNDALISSAYNKLGTTASHGCIRLTTIDAKWIYDNCPIGTTVIIYNDNNPGPLGKPTAMKVDPSNKWDPTDPDPANPWQGRILRIDGVQNMQIERGYGIDLMSGVSAWDAYSNNVTGNIQISTNADINTVGIYAVHYLVTDAYGNTASADAALSVVDTQAPVFAGIPARIEGKRAGEITRSLLLNGVSITDNGQGFPADWVEVRIPALTDGDNQILYVATDASGNQSVASTTVYCDMTAPVISRQGSASSVIALDQPMNADALLARIHVQDVSSVNVTYVLTQENWGYRIDYTATDSYGNAASFTDHVTYVEYEFTGSDTITVKNAEDMTELKSGLSLKSSQGNTMSLPAEVQISRTQISETEYRVVYTYTYSSPVGSHTARFERTAVVAE